MRYQVQVPIMRRRLVLFSLCGLLVLFSAFVSLCGYYAWTYRASIASQIQQNGYVTHIFDRHRSEDKCGSPDGNYNNPIYQMCILDQKNIDSDRQDLIEGVLTFAITLTGSVTAIMGVLATRRAAEVSRAWLVMEHANLKRSQPGRYTFTMRISNFGQSPALKVRLKVRAFSEEVVLDFDDIEYSVIKNNSEVTSIIRINNIDHNFLTSSLESKETFGLAAKIRIQYQDVVSGGKKRLYSCRLTGIVENDEYGFLESIDFGGGYDVKIV